MAIILKETGSRLQFLNLQDDWILPIFLDVRQVTTATIGHRVGTEDPIALNESTHLKLCEEPKETFELGTQDSHQTQRRLCRSQQEALR